ncbi:MAG: DUF4433 domain-containing protein [Rhizobiaceae bacterium]|nr:DUF4433 domain-containing protein [Rhizobiaceae bacterium]
MAIDSINEIPFFYHFTDRRNLPMIREAGGLYPIAQLEKMGLKVPAPGGNEWSRDADAFKGMGNYVHLCFRNNHPMEHVARQAGHIGDTVFLQIHPSVLQFEGVRFTNDVSNKAGVESVPIDKAGGMIDYEVLYTWTNWSDADIKLRLKQAEKYELLVPQFIPLALIRNMPDG